MTTDLEKELQDSIKKNLPQQVGEVLKQRLEQADRDATTVKDQAAKLVERDKEREELEATIAEYKKLDERNSGLQAREKELETKEKNLELNQLKYELAAEKDKTEFSKNVALGLVRNTSYRKTIFDTENLGGNGVVDGTGQYHYPIPTSKSHTSTETQE